MQVRQRSAKHQTQYHKIYAHDASSDGGQKNNNTSVHADVQNNNTHKCDILCGRTPSTSRAAAAATDVPGTFRLLCTIRIICVGLLAITTHTARARQ